MGFFRNVAVAFKPSSIARGLEAAREPQGMAPSTPEVERARAEARAGHEQAKALGDAGQVLHGPAGRHLHGVTMGDTASPDELERRIAQEGVLSVIGALRQERKGEFKAGLRQTLHRDEVPQERDPVARERIAREERAARDAARAPYRADDPVPVTISRLATRGETQVGELLAHLRESGLVARPDRVFGVYRVPDRISPVLTPHSERGRVVEWDVVHAPLDGQAPTAAAAPVVATSFAAAEQWVARRRGEPTVLDEELALAYCQEAGIGPERCLGLARVSEFRALQDGSDSMPITTIVKGVVVVHPDVGPAAYERMAASAPRWLGEPQGVRVEALNWGELARVVHPKIHEPAPVPSPFPYLPATPQELLRAYLEVVGLRPEDCFSAQATVGRARQLQQGGVLTKSWGAKQPCADGEDRTRSAGCQLVLVVHRDRPEYAAGRERWARYQAEVLQARLERGLDLRPTLVTDADVPAAPRGLRTIARVAETIDRLDEWGMETVNRYRYCWPPVAS